MLTKEIVGVILKSHTLFVHAQPDYIVHIEEQPSPLSLLPSSHNDVIIMPSPQ